MTAGAAHLHGPVPGWFISTSKIRIVRPIKGMAAVSKTLPRGTVLAELGRAAQGLEKIQAEIGHEGGVR